LVQLYIQVAHWHAIMHTYTHTYIHTYIHKHVGTLAYTDSHIHPCRIGTDPHTNTYLPISIHTVCTHIHTYTHTCIRTNCHAHTYTHMRTHTHIHTYTHTHMQAYTRT